MAYTITATKVVLGNKRAELVEVTADAASGTIPCGLGSIECIALAPNQWLLQLLKCQQVVELLLFQMRLTATTSF